MASAFDHAVGDVGIQRLAVSFYSGCRLTVLCQQPVYPTKEGQDPMDKPHDTDDTTLLALRFHTLMDKVQGLIDELHVPLYREDEAVPISSDQGRKAYTIHTAAGFDERRKQALIEVIDEALRQIAHLEAADAGPPPCADSKRRATMAHGEKIFTLEELHFLEHTLRTFRAFSSE